MSETRTPESPALPVPADEVGSDLDLDLSDLAPPTPARRQRHPLLMLAIITFASVLMATYWSDVAYFLKSSVPVDLGDSTSFEEQYRKNPDFDPEFPNNAYVRISGLTGMRTSSNNNRMTFFKLAFVPVYLRMGPEYQGQIDTDPTMFVEVSGRLRRMSDIRRYDQLQAYYQNHYKVSFAHAYILEVGAKPRSLWWTVAIVAVLGTVILINFGLLLRRFTRR